jgi:ribosome-associated translation inhibitor RaiA
MADDGNISHELLRRVIDDAIRQRVNDPLERIVNRLNAISQTLVGVQQEISNLHADNAALLKGQQKHETQFEAIETRLLALERKINGAGTGP